MSFTDEQVELLEQIDGYLLHIEGQGSVSKQEMDYLQTLVDNLSQTIINQKKEQDELAEERPPFAGDDC